MKKPSKQTASLDVYKQSFREYLRETKAIQNEHELDKLMALLHEPLPLTFRLNLHHSEVKKVQNLLAIDFQFPSNTYFHEKKTLVNPPKPIAWYPQPQVAWQLDCGRTALSKTAPKYPDIKKFHTCLLEQTEMGTIDRQESVSMIPVLLLDVQPQHRVLDMCASPGSKTTQVIDFLLTNQNVSANQQGMVIANDLNKKRAYMLVHRLTRNTLRKAVVTCGSGDQFPGLYDQDKVLQKTNVFDRVLCDVPCSGDGTLRKNQGLWREWHIGQGITLHPIQLSIVLRGAALLKVGGLMVYSTCSFNPVENEAVVAELLRRSDGALEVMRADYVQKKLPGLIARPGRTKWKVGWRSKSRSSAKGHIFHNLEDKNKENGQELLHDWYEEYDQVPGELVGTRLIRSMFSPTNSVSISKSLENTMRLIPIDQNSGGFYIAVLRKVKNLPSQKQQKEDNQSGLPPQEEALQIPSSDYICKICEKKGHFMKYCDKYVPEEEFMGKLTTKPCEQEEDDDKQKIKRRKLQERREHLFRPLSQEIWASLENFYGIQRQDLMNHLWCRSEGAPNIHYVDMNIASTCLAGDALDIVNTGIKVLTKVVDNDKNFYRVTQEGLGWIEGFFTKRLYQVSKEDFVKSLSTAQHLSFVDYSSSLQHILETIEIGPAIFQFSQLAVNVWIGKGAILPRLSKQTKRELEQKLDLVQQ